MEDSSPVASLEMEYYCWTGLHANLISTGYFTIDFWIYPNERNESLLFGCTQAGDSIRQCGALFLYIYNGLGITFHADNTSESLYFHVHISNFKKWSAACLMVCHNWNVMIFIDGYLKGEGLLKSSILPSYSLRLGGQNRRDGDPLYSIKSKIDEFRVSDIARWTSNFTPPTKPYV